MESLRSDLSIYWSESAGYIAAYAAYAVVACVAVAWFEYAQQSSAVSFPKLLGKGLALAGATSAVFAVALFLASWRHQALGELVTILLSGLLLAFAAWGVNRLLSQSLGLETSWPRLLAWLPPVLLAGPFLLFNGFILLLGSAWKN